MKPEETIPVAKPYLTKDEAQAAYDTILTGWITQGPRVQEFETNFSAYTGALYSVAVSNCTTALHLSMIVAGIGPGDEVICPSYSYVATANCIRYVGATPIFCDVDFETGNLSLKETEALIGPKTKAVLLVHQIGLAADIDGFAKLCQDRKLTLIEDAACAVGSSYKDKKVGSHSSLVCFSFHPRKVISTGDGGMICTNNLEWAERLKRLRQHAMSVNDRVRHESKTLVLDDHLELGYNYRLTDIQAAVGIQQLKKLDWIVSERRKIGEFYHQSLENITRIRLSQALPGNIWNHQSFSVFIENISFDQRNILIQKLLESKVSARKGIMTSHRETAYQNFEARRGGLSISEKLSDQSIIIPLFVPMSNSDIERVVQVFKKSLAEI